MELIFAHLFGEKYKNLLKGLVVQFLLIKREEFNIEYIFTLVYKDHNLEGFI